MKVVLKRLEENQSIKVLQADKGRASIVLEADTHQTKMSIPIENGPYQRLNKRFDGPSDEEVVRETVKLRLKRSGYLSEAVYKKIKPRHEQLPRVYGLPEIHKAGIPLRPIVSCFSEHLRK